jgi:hypothetical protein
MEASNMYDIKNLKIWKDEPRKDNFSDTVSHLDLSEMNLSQRPYNCLRRAGCQTVGDVLEMVGEDGSGLLRIRNLGAVSKKEILESLERIRADYPDGLPGLSPTHEGGKIRLLLRPAKKIWDSDIESFHLSDYALTKLHASGIRRVRDLYATNPKQEPGWYAVRELFSKIQTE